MHIVYITQMHLILHNELLCKDMCSVRGGGGGANYGGGTNRKDPKNLFLTITWLKVFSSYELFSLTIGNSEVNLKRRIWRKSLGSGCGK